MAKLIKSIYTGVDVTALGEFTTSDSIEHDVVFAQDVTIQGVAVGDIVIDNDLSFNMVAGNNFKCTPTGTGTLTFTNITSGQSGNIWLDNTGGYVISAAASTLIAAADLTTISTAGVYFMSYYSDGTNVAVSVTPGVTSGGA